MFGLSDIVVTFFSVVTVCRLWTLNGRVTHAAFRITMTCDACSLHDYKDV